MKALTPRQQQILDFIKSHAMANGMPPTRQEITDHCGFASPNAAQEHLVALGKKGYISMQTGKARSIKVLV